MSCCPPTNDIPGVHAAFAGDDIAAAYDMLRQSHVLPEMCSQLAPGDAYREHACVENVNHGAPVPIRAIRHTVCRLAREQGLTPLHVPSQGGGRSVAVVGGGPAGVAAAIGLVKLGHAVTVIECNDRLGGTPERLIPAGRFAGAVPEIDAILAPAIDAGRLQVRLEQAFGKDVTLPELHHDHDAVLLAAGLWKEISLGEAGGVVDAQSFLEAVKRGHWSARPRLVAVLSGGDCAMDAAVTAFDIGATNVTVVYGGSLDDMHWHLPDTWFDDTGARCLTLTDPLGYETDADGNLSGLRVCNTEYGPPDAQGERYPAAIPGSESLMTADLVIEAMGLAIDEDLRAALGGLAFTETGLLATAGEGRFATNVEGVFVAGALVNGGASVEQCVTEGTQTAQEIDSYLVQRG